MEVMKASAGVAALYRAKTAVVTMSEEEGEEGRPAAWSSC